MDSPVISSRDNTRIKHISKLLKDKSFRYLQGEYVIEGLKAVKDSKDIKEIYLSESAKPVKLEAEKKFFVKDKVFESVSSTENSQGILGVAKMAVRDDSAIRKDLRYIFLDRVQDPGNMGTIIRTAVAFGIKGIIFLSGTVDPFSPKAVRASAGSIGKLDIIKVGDYSSFKGFTLIAADTKGEKLNGFRWPEGFILAIGNEGAGLSEGILSAAKHRVSIPMPGGVESLNAAVSAGILLYTSLQN